MKRTSEIDGDYRYSLRIPISTEPEKKVVACLLCNPSTADTTNDDPTSRNLKKWAAENDVGMLIIVNLYAYISARLERLKPLTKEDAVGSRNLDFIRAAAEEADEMIVAWGNPPRSRKKQEFLSLTREALSLLQEKNKPLFHIGMLTKQNQPRHAYSWYMKQDRQKRIFNPFD